MPLQHSYHKELVLLNLVGPREQRQMAVGMAVT